MKIAIVSQPLDSVLPPHQNSVGIWTYEVAKRLAQNHQVLVYYNAEITRLKRASMDGVEFIPINSIPYRRLRRMTDPFARMRPAQRPFFSSPIFSLEYIFQIAIDLRQQRCDIIHLHNFSQFVPIVRALNPNAQIILHMHCEWLSQLDPQMIEQRLRKADMVVGCSHYIIEKVRQRFPNRTWLYEAVHNGVNLNLFTAKEPLCEAEKHPPRLVFVSRLSPEKGVHILLRAFSMVAKHFPDLELELIGKPSRLPLEFLLNISDDPRLDRLTLFYQGSYKDHLMREIPAHLSEQVHFLGHLPHHLIPAHIRKADVLINPAISEPFGMSLVEGMASQVPVVAPRIGGMVEIVAHDSTGFLVNPDDPVDLAKALMTLLENAPLRESMGRAGRSRVQQMFTWECITSQVIKQYEELVSVPTQRRSRSLPLPLPRSSIPSQKD